MMGFDRLLSEIFTAIAAGFLLLGAPDMHTVIALLFATVTALHAINGNVDQ